MFQDLIQAAPKACSAPNMSRHGRFPTSTRLFPVDDVAGQWGARGYAVHLGGADRRYSPPARACKPNGKALKRGGARHAPVGLSGGIGAPKSPATSPVASLVCD